MNHTCAVAYDIVGKFSTLLIQSWTKSAHHFVIYQILQNFSKRRENLSPDTSPLRPPQT